MINACTWATEQPIPPPPPAPLVCPDGEAEYVLTMNDSFGDGWNGNILSIAGQNYTLLSDAFNDGTYAEE